MDEASPTQFLETEYQERWEYVRHTETIRYRAIQWYFVVVGALTAFAFTELPIITGSQFPDESGQAAIFLALTAYSFLVCYYLVGQKTNYRKQRERCDLIEEEVLGYKPMESDPNIEGGVFANYYRTVAWTGGGASGLSAFFIAHIVFDFIGISGDLTISGMSMGLATASTITQIIVAGIVGWLVSRHLTDHQKEKRRSLEKDIEAGLRGTKSIKSS